MKNSKSSLDVCPHMLFNKSLKERIRCIPVSIFPDPTIDSFTNVNVKCGNQYKSNIQTLAYQKYNHFHEETNDQRNYIKDFYMENYQQEKMVLNNNIVQELADQMYRNSAYVLADKATVDYEQFQQKRKQSLNKARNRAQSVYHSYKVEKTAQQQLNQEQNGYWLKKLFRKLQEIAKHIVSGQGQDDEQRQKQFLQSKSYLTPKFLSQIKIRDPKKAYQILSQLRTLMQKKKLLFSDERQQQQINKSATMSFASQASQNMSQGSMISCTTINQSNIFGQDQVVDQFWDFQELKKKWNLKDIQQVKDMLRRMFTRKVVYEAEVEAVKKRRQSQRITKQLISMNQQKSLPKKQQEITGQRKSSLVRKKALSTKQNRPKKPEPSNQLNNQQQAIKNKLIKGGRFDATGEKFERNRRYSQLFSTRQSQINPIYMITGQNKNTLITKNSLLGQQELKKVQNILQTTNYRSNRK